MIDGVLRIYLRRHKRSPVLTAAIMSTRPPGRSFRTPARHSKFGFHAIYLFVTTRHGVSDNELERTFGMTYKTAWRMAFHIRSLMMKADGFEKLQGHVEADEAFVGGKQTREDQRRGSNKTIVMGLKERRAYGCRNDSQHDDGRSAKDCAANREAGLDSSTDEYAGYNLLTEDGYIHGSVNHSAGE